MATVAAPGGVARDAGAPRPGTPHEKNWFVQVQMVAHMQFH